MAKRLILMCRFRSFSISNLSPQSEYLAFVSVKSRAEDEMRRSNTLQSAWTKLASESHLCSFRSLFFVSFKFLLSLFASVQSRAEDEMRRKQLELICWESTLALILALIPVLVLVLVLVLVQAGAVLCYQIIVFLKWACQGAHELNDNSSELGRKSISSIFNHGTTHLTYRIPGIRVKNLPVTRLPLRVIAQPWNVLGASQGG